MSENQVESLQSSFAFYGAEQGVDVVPELHGGDELYPDFSLDRLAESELTEVLCSDSMGALYALLPCLARLSEKDRWITLIAPPGDLDEKIFALFGINPSRVLLIHPKDKEQETSVMNTALKNGKSGIVVYWTNHLSKRFLAQWRKSVKQGNCIGVVVNSSNKVTESSSLATTLRVLAFEKYVRVQRIKEFNLDVLGSNETILPRFAFNSKGVEKRMRGYRSH